MRDILSMSYQEVEKLMKEFGQPIYRAGQIFEWLHRRGATSFDEMSNLSKGFRAQLNERCYIASVEVVRRLESKTDGTVKYLYGLNDDTLIESVLMEYQHGYSVCVSTQAGCRMGCSFCASGMDFSRNLTAGEICAQVYGASMWLPEGGRVGSVVFMGCGEPLDNFDATVNAVELLASKQGLNIGQRHITVSTCGLVPQIAKLAKLKLQITLAVSLYAPTYEVRRRLMPIARTYPLKELIGACRHYIQETGRRVTFEYALAKGVNDSLEQAKALVNLLRGLNCHVNLIPINVINKTQGGFNPTLRKEIAAFADVLKHGHIQTTVRRSLGGDVDAACGQLRGGLR